MSRVQVVAKDEYFYTLRYDDKDVLWPRHVPDFNLGMRIEDTPVGDYVPDFVLGKQESSLPSGEVPGPYDGWGA